MKIFFSFLLLCTVFAAVTYISVNHQEYKDPLLYNYVIRHYEEETHAHNAVAAILLNYRMYDTMFEALILLTAIIGMKQFLPGAGEVKAYEEKEKSKR